MKISLSEALVADLDEQRWLCGHCDSDLGPLDRNYKEGCQLAARDPEDVHPIYVATGASLTFAPDPAWCMLIEVYCPGCYVLLDSEYLPYGHPVSHDIDIDGEELSRWASGYSIPSSDGPTRL